MEHSEDDVNRVLTDIELASLVLAGLILFATVLLGYREGLDRTTRQIDVPHEDERHFSRRDRRRSLGLSILCILALGIVVGSRTPIRVAQHANPWFLGIWLTIFALILVLLILALIDWVDLRRFARQKHLSIGRERDLRIRAQIDQLQQQDQDDDRDPLAT